VINTWFSLEVRDGVGSELVRESSWKEEVLERLRMLVLCWYCGRRIVVVQ
jgi:hypothetical protein